MISTAGWALRNAANRIHHGDAPTTVFEETVSEIARAGGDADTNGIVAGALVGTLIGFQSLPQPWITDMPYGMWLDAWIQKLLFMMELPVVANEAKA